MKRVMLVLLLWAVHSPAQGDEAPTPSPAGELELFVGETSVMPRPTVQRVIVGRSNILTASVLATGDVVLVARSPGHTSLSMLDANGKAERWSIRVVPVDMQHLAREISGFLGQMPNVSVRVLGDKVIVDGTDLSESQLFKLGTLEKHYPQVVNLAAFQKDRAWEKMVLVDVRVVEIARNRTRDLGIRWEPTLPGPQVEPFKGRIGVASSIGSTISLLETEGDAVVLADPQLSARSGKKASFLVGGEIPYQAINQDGSAQVTFKKFGVEVDVTPVAMESGSIVSSVRAMVSEPDASLNPLSGVPGLRSREAETWFNVKSGQTMVIAGLLQRNESTTNDRVPGAARIPILGHLFKGRRTQRRATELVILVTARTVEAADPQLLQSSEELRGRALQKMGRTTPPSSEQSHAR